ncbi:MAG: ribosome biogenesis factor YjgA [Nitrosomonas sp.]|nr:ribosome biogenesis factor YjgA [Nitrosomonas sp.]
MNIGAVTARQKHKNQLQPDQDLPSDGEIDSGPSKTRVKQQMHALQALGEQLVRLDPEQLRQLGLPDSLLEALLEARHINKYGARRRQMQFIGKWMRAIDPLPVQEKLDGWQRSSVSHTAWLHRIEKWRERLLSDETALTEFAEIHPQADIQQLRTMLRNAQQERLANKPPKNFRALFKLLRDIIPQKSG